MRKLSLPLGAMAIAGAMFLSSCSKDEVLNPDVVDGNATNYIQTQTRSVAGVQVINFNDLTPGQVLTSVDGSLGSGPIMVSGQSPHWPGGEQCALVFNSATPTGGDFDLGSPNEDFGGPGIGIGGEAGAAYQNNTALNNIVIIAENLTDANNDGIVDDPDDVARYGSTIEFDFTYLDNPAILHSMTLMDVEDAENNGSGVRMYDIDDNEIGFVPFVTTGDNGVTTLDLGGTAGVAYMVVEMNGTGAIDNIMFEEDVPETPTCEECDGGITSFTLNYDGNLNWVKFKVKQADGTILFHDWVADGDDFSFSGAKYDGTMGSKIYIYANGCYYKSIETDCDDNVGPGYEEGALTVVSATSRDGGELCDYTPPTTGGGCHGGGWGGGGHHGGWGGGHHGGGHGGHGGHGGWGGWGWWH